MQVFWFEREKGAQAAAAAEAEAPLVATAPAEAEAGGGLTEAAAPSAPAAKKHAYHKPQMTGGMIEAGEYC